MVAGSGVASDNPMVMGSFRQAAGRIQFTLIGGLSSTTTDQYRAAWKSRIPAGIPDA